MVRSASFAVTLRENIARYFGVPVKNQALYDEDGLLTTNADLLRTLQRVNPMLYVHDVKDMSAQLRDHTEKELAFIDAEVEQSRRNLRLKGHTMRFGASDTQLRPDQMLEGVCEENSGNTGEPIAEGINVSKEPLANGMDQWQGQVGAAPSGTGSTTAMSSAHVEASSIATVDDAHCPSLAAPATLSAQMLASMATPARSPGARGHLAEIPVEVELVGHKSEPVFSTELMAKARLQPAVKVPFKAGEGSFVAPVRLQTGVQSPPHPGPLMPAVTAPGSQSPAHHPQFVPLVPPPGSQSPLPSAPLMPAMMAASQVHPPQYTGMSATAFPGHPGLFQPPEQTHMHGSQASVTAFPGHPGLVQPPEPTHMHGSQASSVTAFPGHPGLVQPPEPTHMQGVQANLGRAQWLPAQHPADRSPSPCAAAFRSRPTTPVAFSARSSTPVLMAVQRRQPSMGPLGLNSAAVPSQSRTPPPVARRSQSPVMQPRLPGNGWNGSSGAYPSFVAQGAQSQPQLQLHSAPQLQPPSQLASQPQLQPPPQSQPQLQPHSQPQLQPQTQPQHMMQPSHQFPCVRPGTGQLHQIPQQIVHPAQLREDLSDIRLTTSSGPSPEFQQQAGRFFSIVDQMHKGGRRQARAGSREGTRIMRHMQDAEAHGSFDGDVESIWT